MLNNEFFELMADRNPFLFKSDKGKVLLFDDYSDAYCELLCRMYDASPRGYLDLVLFLHNNEDFPNPYAEDFLVHFYDSGALPKSAQPLGVVMIDWDDVDGQMYLLECLMVGFHWLTETSFDKEMFLSGVMKFMNKKEVKKYE